MQKVNYLLFTVIVAALLAISGCSERVPQEPVQDRNDEMADTSMILNEKPTSLENVMEATRVDIERLMESQSPSDFLGADGIELDYADHDRIVFHTFAGLFVCEREGENWKLTRTLDLKPLEADITQGDRACLIQAGKEEARIMPLRYAADHDNPETYTYRYLDNRLTKTDSFQEQDSAALRWSYAEEGGKLREQILDKMKQSRVSCSNIYPIGETDAEVYGFVAVGSDGLRAMQCGFYDKKTDHLVLHDIDIGGEDHGEYLTYQGVRLYHNPLPEKVCIEVEPPILGEYRSCYYIPSDAEQGELIKLVSDMEQGFETYDPEKHGLRLTLKENGWRLKYRDTVYWGREDHYISASHYSEENESTELLIQNEELCSRITKMVEEKLDYQTIDPSEIKDIVSAELSITGMRVNGGTHSQTITDESTLNMFEELFSNAKHIWGGGGCGNEQACLTLYLADGRHVTLQLATDSCTDFGLNGVHYDYRPRKDKKQGGWYSDDLFRYFDKIPIKLYD